MGYLSYIIGFLTCICEPDEGQCQAGSLTGAVASKRVTEALEGHLRMIGNHSKSVKAKGGLTARATVRAGTKVGLSDPVVLSGNAIAQRIKAVRELGSERRETVRSLSVVGEGYLRGAVLSTRGPEWTYQW